MGKETGGWTGRLLWIDLQKRLITISDSKPYTSRLIGGLGLALQLAWETIPRSASALGPDNRLIFAAGPLTGTPAPGSGRMEILARSPRSYPQETITRSGLGGHFGARLKLAGFDALILSGCSSSPLTIHINPDGASLHPAHQLWGLDTFQVQQQLQQSYGLDAQTVCIGPAGENKCLNAAIMHGTSHCSGKAGFGAVMGAMGLKAITVSGHQRPLKIAHPAKLLKLRRQARELTVNNPLREWTVGYEPPAHHKAFYQRYRTGNVGCSNCPLQCFAMIRLPEMDPAQIGCVNFFYMEPAHEYYGPGTQADKALWQASLLCNKLGLDTFELAGLAPLVRDLYQAGLITVKQSGFPVDRFGSLKFITGLIECIAYRRGLGQFFAQGAARASDQIPEAWNFYQRYYPAHGQTEHNSVRDFPVIALLWALDSRDPMIDHHAYRHLSISRMRWPEPYRLQPIQAEKIAARLFGSAQAINHSSYEEKAKVVVLCQNKARVIDSLVLCDFLYPAFVAQGREDRIGNTALEAQLLHAVTGLDIEESDLDQIGERIYALERAIMASEGRTREDDSLHENNFQERQPDQCEPHQGMRLSLSLQDSQAINRHAFEQAKDEFYKIRGFDPKTGWPSTETLKRLDLSDIANQMASESPVHEIPRGRTSDLPVTTKF